MEIHESAEDYLEMILILKQRLGKVRSIDIVNEMNYSKPSVSIAMKKLRENGYITTDGNGYIEFSNSGFECANRIYDRHKTITNFLIQIGVSSEIASQDACRIEHDINEETFKKIKDQVK
ncbi:MAG: metal-dependent transcriptional regulator [Oscillospiraceae bacterium]